MGQKLAYEVLRQTDLPFTERFVFYVLCLLDKDGECFPLIKTVAGMTGLSERSVQRALAKLARNGYVQSKRRTGRASLYFIAPVDQWKNLQPVQTVQGACLTSSPVLSDVADREEVPDADTHEGACQNDPLFVSDTPDKQNRHVSQTPIKVNKYVDSLFISLSKETGIDSDWTPPNEWIDVCKQMRPEIDPLKLGAKFAAYYSQRAQVMKEELWLEKWKQWIRNERADKTNRLGKGGNIQPNESWAAFLKAEQHATCSETIELMPASLLEGKDD